MCKVRSATCRPQCATLEVLCTRRCLLCDKLRCATCRKVLCDKLRSYAVRSNGGYAVKPSRESGQKESGRSRLALVVDSASVLVVDSAFVLSATCVDPCAVCYDILNLPQRVRVRSDANHCARFIAPGCNEPSATEYPFTIT